MSEYKDHFERWHDRPVTYRDMSNNAWIYTAYAKELGLVSQEDNKEISQAFRACKRSTIPLKVDRHPGRFTPPISKDEIIGLISLGFIDNKTLYFSNYNYCNLNVDFDRKLEVKSFFKALIALWKIRKEHRNFFWKCEIIEAYPLAFKLMPWDIYYSKVMGKATPTYFEIVVFYLNYLYVFIAGSTSIKNVTWLQCKNLGYQKLARYLSPVKNFKKYFGEQHPFYLKIAELAKEVNYG